MSVLIFVLERRESIPVLMASRVRRVTTLSGVSGIQVGRAIRINLVLAVRLIVVLALLTLQARVYLGTDANTLADLSESNLLADLEDLANDFVSNSQRVGAAAPVARDSVHVAGADAAALDLDVDIVRAEGARRPRVLLKLEPVFRGGSLEARKLFGVGRHGAGV